jgi:HSP20 family molecular chaperone IbpA
MKSPRPDRRTPSARAAMKRAPDHAAQPLRECLGLHDLTDCLLEAYDCVARRAYEKFLERGGRPGGELADWVSAERELLPSLPAHISESGGVLYAMVSVPGATAAAVSVAVEPECLVILARSKPDGDSPARSFCVVELPVEVDAARSSAVLADGILAVRMPCAM